MSISKLSLVRRELVSAECAYIGIAALLEGVSQLTCQVNGIPSSYLQCSSSQHRRDEELADSEQVFIDIGFLEVVLYQQLLAHRQWSRLF